MKKPKGTVDFFPEDYDKQKKIFSVLRKTADSFGFQEVLSPAMEEMDLLTKKAGDEVSSQIFTLDQRGDERLGLRFDLTIPLTRMFIEKQKELPKPVKWYSLSRMWRYERPQKGRLREFFQLSVELFGSSSPESDAEVINLAIMCFRNLGLTSKDFYVRVNNRKLLQGILEEYSKDVNPLISLVDKKEKISDEAFIEGLKELGVKDAEKLKSILETKDIKELENLSLNEQAKEGLEELKQVLNYTSNKFVELNLTTARGLAYYSGTVFELFDRTGEFRSLAGGGRYDDLIEQFGGEKCPATGFAIGYATLSLLLEQKGLLLSSKVGVDYYIIIIGKGQLKEKALSMVAKIRKKNSVDYDLVGRNTKKQMDYANKIKAKNVIFIGEKEIWTNTLSIKNMKTGKDKSVPLSDII